MENTIDDHSVKILLVDDKKENLLSLQVILAGQGYQFVEAASGKDALRILLKNQDFAIILMDVQMPLMDGFETAEMIRQSDKLKHVPIIFLTANMNSTEYIFKGYQSGAVDYMIKPLSSGILQAKVKVFVDLYRKNRELRIKEAETNALNSMILKANETLAAQYAAIEKHAAELHNKNKELDAFTYISSHDLQEPLRKIQTFANQLAESEFGNLSETGKNKFLRMQNAAERMQTLINDLLAYSRTNTHDEEKNFQRIQLNDVIAEVQEDLREELQNLNASIITNGLCEINIIPFQFQQLLYNLVSNSLKFAREGIPSEITIHGKVAKGADLGNEKLNKENSYCHISYTDNGIGFEQQYNEKIFEVFQRLHGKEQYKGTGIGLAIVKKIVENHNGVITATGEPMKGAKFNIYIPN